MKKRRKYIAISVLIGLLIFAGVIWLLSKTLGDLHETLYAGHSMTYWHQQLDGSDTGASNKAYAVVNTQIVPQLIDTMFHDTNDSKIRVPTIIVLNRLPGIQINFFLAVARRSSAARDLGELGPAVKVAVPALIEAVNGEDSAPHESGITALGKIHSDPGVVIRGVGDLEIGTQYSFLNIGGSSLHIAPRFSIFRTSIATPNSS